MKQDLTKKFRHEYKYYVNIADYYAIKNGLSHFAKPDSHAGVDGKYLVRSLYFETPDDKVLLEKQYGLNDREKFRIRYYNNDTSWINLEKKSKVNGYGKKLSAPLTKEQCEKLIAGDIQWMKQSEHALITELYLKMKLQLLKPKTIVDYMREPFVYAPGNVRITIDSEIKTGILAKDFFNQDLPVIRSNAGNVIILEVKYDSFLPDIIKCMIQSVNRKPTAFSKYVVSRIYG